jgi:hypothetical protein
VTVKNKGPCISEPKKIQYIVSPELDYLNMSDVLHNSAAASCVCVVWRLAFGMEAQEFYFKQKKFKFQFFMSVTSPSE